MPISRRTNFVDLDTCNSGFNCQFIRPGRNMNLQPIAGQVLPYAYMNTMGSALAKKNINANIIINATANRKNTVTPISRSVNCYTPNKCGVSSICSLCTGNKNPNFINRY